MLLHGTACVTSSAVARQTRSIRFVGYLGCQCSAIRDGDGDESRADGVGSSGTEGCVSTSVRSSTVNSSNSDLPWSLSAYYTKKRGPRRTDTLGNVITNELAEPPGWGEDMRWALALQAVARDEGVLETEAADALELLAGVLPDLAGCGKPADAVRLALRVREAPGKLLALREALPGVNVGRIGAGAPELLLLGEGQLVECARGALQLLSSAGPPEAVAAALEAQPRLLLPGVLAATLDELDRLMGTGKAPAMLLRNPGLALMCEGLQHQARGARDAEYVADAFAERPGQGDILSHMGDL